MLTLLAVAAGVLALAPLEAWISGLPGLAADGPGLARAAASFAAFVIGALPFVVAELLEDRRAVRLARPLAIWATFFVLANVVVWAGSWIKSGTGIERGSGVVAATGAAHLLLYIVLIDFFGYWFHRAEHAVPLLWRFHATHHSIRHLSAVESYVHWLEGAFRFAGVLLPVSLLVPTPPPDASVLAVIWGVWTIYTHSSARALRLPRGLRWLFVDNQAHHLHHGRARAYHDCNFGFFLTVWDRAFGTWRAPEGDHFPETGLDDTPPPAGPAGYLVHPFGAARPARSRALSGARSAAPAASTPAATSEGTR